MRKLVRINWVIASGTIRHSTTKEWAANWFGENILVEDSDKFSLRVLGKAGEDLKRIRVGFHKEENGLYTDCMPSSFFRDLSMTELLSERLRSGE